MISTSKTLLHGADSSLGISVTEIMLEIQKAKEFPIFIKIGKGTTTIKNKEQATFFSLGMLMTLEAKEEELKWNVADAAHP